MFQSSGLLPSFMLVSARSREMGAGKIQFSLQEWSVSLSPSKALQAAGNIFACFSDEALFLRSGKDGILLYWHLGIAFSSVR